MSFGARQLFRKGWLSLVWIGSWDRPIYPRFGAWRGSGVTLRYKSYLLVIAK